MGGISIMKPNPFHTGNVGHTLHQLCNMLLAIDVNAIIGQFLGNHLKLLHPLRDQMLYFRKDLLHRTALMTTGNNRNGTIGTMAVTALCYLQIGVMLGGGQMSADATQSCLRRDETAVFFFLQVLQQTRIVKLAIIAIHTGNLSFKVGLVTL